MGCNYKMNRSDFCFELPSHLIAQTPSTIRGEDRLLVLNKSDGSFHDDVFSSLPHLLPKNALLVFNDSRVRHARVYAHKITESDEAEGNENHRQNYRRGRQSIEFLFLKTLDEGKRWKVLSPKMKRLKVGDRFLFASTFTKDKVSVEVNGGCVKGEDESSVIATLQEYGDTGEKILFFEEAVSEDFFDTFGSVPLPPYIKREAQAEDSSRYQTVYASNIGSIAAPTAGLHFTPSILKELKELGMELCYVTLHVGLGTFLPVREERIEKHKMHTEEFIISEEVAEAINIAKKDRRPIIACGTTSVRTLEAAWDSSHNCIQAGKTSTNIFIYPPYHFNVVDGIITNFHTPESTLLMLVSAFCGRENILKAYEHAVQEEYRFFSYGDAMLIL